MRAGATSGAKGFRKAAGVWFRALRGAVRLVNHTAREIFDEAAYARYLDQEGMAASRESYAAFAHERHTQGRPRPRCC
jgi:hypothetical protein